MTKAAGFLGTAILAVWGTAAGALGLGDINVSSALNQRFHAVIPLTSATPDELSTLQVQIASNDEFAREGIERGDYLSTLTFEVVTEGQPRIVISSPQVAQDPALTFVVDAHWASGRLLKEYTALLDLAPAEPVKTPGVSSSESSLAPTPLPSQLPAAAPAPTASAPSAPFVPAAPKPVAKPAPRAAPKQKPVTTTAPQAEAPTLAAPAEPAAGEAKYYGPVQPQETLWHIATKLRPDISVSMDQTMAALYAANPTAFHNGLNVIKGTRLRVPTMDEIRANSPADATKALDQIRHGGRPALAAAPAAAATLTAPTEAPAPKPAKPPKAKISKPAPAPKPAPSEAPAEVLPPPPSVAPTPPATPAPKESAPTPSAATSAAPAPSAASTAAAPAAAASAPAPAAVQPPAEAPKQAPLSPPPAPESGLPVPLLGGLGAVLAALVGFFLWRRSNSAKTAAAPKPAAPRSAPPKFEPARPPEPPPAPEAEEAPAAAEQAHEDTATLTQDASLDATTTLDQPSITIDQAPPGGQKSDEIDFDITSQIEAQTVPISLEANDPISEADFHLAYGLYDEAILLLKEAIQKDPARNELRVKLAETYFAAGRPLEFQEAAEPLKGKIAAADWQKLAIMGRQICPDSPVFHEETQAAADASALDFAFSDEQQPPAAAPAAAPAAFTPGSNVLDFDADALSTGRPNSLVGNMSERAEGTASTDLDLSQFDLNNEPTDEGGAKPAPKSSPADGSVEFNLDELDLGKPNAFMPAKGETSEGSAEAVDFGDEVSTKLDLARAYVDMGDNEAARSLLNEVLTGGNSAQKQEAETLLKRLTG